MTLKHWSLIFIFCRILLLAILAGLFFLALVSFILWHFGFFTRRRHQVIFVISTLYFLLESIKILETLPGNLQLSGLAFKFQFVTSNELQLIFFAPNNLVDFHDDFLCLQDSLSAYAQAGTIHEKQPLAVSSHVARPSTVQSSFFANGTSSTPHQNGYSHHNGNGHSNGNGHGLIHHRATLSRTPLRNGRLSTNSGQYPDLQPGDVVLWSIQAKTFSNRSRRSRIIQSWQ